MKKKILIVEDDNFFREALKLILTKKFDVIEAQHGRQAKDLIIFSHPDLILSDIQMPFLNGVELLEWLNEYKKIPIILMTGFSKVIETQKAHQLGVSNFLVKPFEESELLIRINSLIGDPDTEDLTTKPPPPKDSEESFCKIPIDDFITEKETEYGIYIKVGENRYIKIAHKGGKIPESKIVSYKEKGISHLYVKKEDFARIVGFSVQITKALGPSEIIDKEKKLRFMKYTGELLVQQSFKSGVDENLFLVSKDFLASSIDLFSTSDSGFKLIESLSGHSDYLYAHALNVSILAVLIAKKMGIQSPQYLFKIALGGLFHDIGKKEIPMEVLKKSRALLSPQERSLIESHTTRGRDILESNRSIPSEVILSAYEHHEDNLGQGFPQGISKERIHPFSRIVGLANAVIEYILPLDENTKPKTLRDAISTIETYKKNSFDAEALIALKKVSKG